MKIQISNMRIYVSTWSTVAPQQQAPGWFGWEQK